MEKSKDKVEPKRANWNPCLSLTPSNLNAVGDLQENLAPFHHHRATHTPSRKVGEVVGTDMVGVNEAVSPGAVPNQPGELGDASVPDTGRQHSEHTNMAAALFSPSRFGTKCPLWPTLA